MHSSYKAAMTFDMIISSNVDLDTNKIIFPNCDASECEWDYFDSFYEEYIAKLNLALVMAFVLHNLICMCGIQKCISMKFIIQAKIMSKK